jgi:hypothetical protein
MDISQCGKEYFNPFLYIFNIKCFCGVVIEKRVCYNEDKANRREGRK